MTAGLHLHADFIAQCVHLTRAGARCDHEKVHDRRDTGQIEYHCVFTAILFAQLGYLASVFQAALQSIF